MNDRTSSKVRCGVCPHDCAIVEGMLGVCGARGCENGGITDLNFGQATALALDSIEKKPLAQFHPGSLILSYGSFGCNMRCPFCQNADISMADARSSLKTTFISPEELVEQAVRFIPQGNIGVALTYNEPLIAPEYLIEVGKLVHDADLLLVVVSNGFASARTLDETLPYIDAMNIDLKCFDEEGYASLGAPGALEAVKRTIATALERGIHVEVTTLVVPGLSDSEESFRRECEWLSELDPSIPLHISRFFPTYMMSDSKATDPSVLYEFEGIARSYLSNVYLGNI